ncbi:SH3 domain-containing protein [Butyrivibrio sp. YAB3001]|uniref:SH3 domain-containing protein n=1 Tax=Butyrivibrio sp. YAB3001 TaxID=1520812 RepID=UPI0008F63D4B|nr:SH3 domain-containing protein [Butyrivibrio sp. YAB3001]SFC88471.1 hypothetical protein SAMN02910398_03406 [Butyrivibrio sp. YAB3001]
MADKITNFEDYKKKGSVEDTDIDIQIEDPYNFFNEQEREEYFQERQKEANAEALKKEAEREEIIEAKEKEEPRNGDESEKEASLSFREKKSGKRREAVKREEPDSYEDDYDEEADEEEASEGGFPIELFIRISSIITGIVILILLGIVVKVKFIDKYFVKDPDEVQTVVAALPAGYIEKNDTVVVTAAVSLNLRSVDNKDSDTTIVTSVSNGTELKRLAVKEDGTWALVEYNGSKVYASMKYLSVKESN